MIMRRTLLDRLTMPAFIVLIAGLGGSAYIVCRPPHVVATISTQQVDAIAVAPLSVPALTKDELSVVWRGIDPAPPPVRLPASTPAAAKPTPVAKAPFLLKVRGIIFSDDGHSVAFLESGKQMTLCRAGATVSGWRVDRIGKYAITVSKGEEVRELTVEHPGFDAMPVDHPRQGTPRGESPLRSHHAARAGASTTTRPGNSTSRRSASIDREKTIIPSTKPPPNDADVTIAVRQEDVDFARNTPMAAVRGLTFEPAMRDGAMEGASLRKIPKGSLAARYGFAPGDRIIAVNGDVIDSPQKMFQLYRRYQNSSAVRITIERNGKRRDILYYAH